jgi:hypothetical protein
LNWLLVGEDEAATPTAAVSQFLVAILYEGMSGMTFTVHDRSSGGAPTVVVQEGKIWAAQSGRIPG